MRRRTINIFNDARTLAAQTLAYEGFALETISKAVSLTRGQLNYRLRHLGISVVDWRKGKSAAAKIRIEEILTKHHLPTPRTFRPFRRTAG